jgi:hypothetical protein
VTIATLDTGRAVPIPIRKILKLFHLLGIKWFSKSFVWFRGTAFVTNQSLVHSIFLGNSDYFLMMLPGTTSDTKPVMPVSDWWADRARGRRGR